MLYLVYEGYEPDRGLVAIFPDRGQADDFVNGAETCEIEEWEFGPPEPGARFRRSYGCRIKLKSGEMQHDWNRFEAITEQAALELRGWLSSPEEDYGEACAICYTSQEDANRHAIELRNKYLAENGLTAPEAHFKPDRPEPRGGTMFAVTKESILNNDVSFSDIANAAAKKLFASTALSQMLVFLIAFERFDAVDLFFTEKDQDQDFDRAVTLLNETRETKEKYPHRPAYIQRMKELLQDDPRLELLEGLE